VLPQGLHQLAGAAVEPPVAQIDVTELATYHFKIESQERLASI
jgi:hypothetical protein